MTRYPVPERVVRRVVELAGRAPSVHNTQPWRWRWDGERLDLYADRTRQLDEADASGRDLMISCGAALRQAEAAAAALGWTTEVVHWPEGPDSDLLARTRFARSVVPADAASVIDAIEARCTDRRRFTAWPVPDERLAQLASIVTQRPVRALPLVEVTARFRAELLIDRAADLHLHQPAVGREATQWVGSTDAPRTADGIPAEVVPDAGTGRGSRFGSGVLSDAGGREIEGSDGLLVLCAPHDVPDAWLSAGAGLIDLWLDATRAGLSVVPLSQVVELGETRTAFRDEVLGGLATPLLLVRVGWQAISRSQLPRTPRRPVDDVLEIV